MQAIRRELINNHVCVDVFDHIVMSFMPVNDMMLQAVESCNLESIKYYISAGANAAYGTPEYDNKYAAMKMCLDEFIYRRNHGLNETDLMAVVNYLTSVVNISDLIDHLMQNGCWDEIKTVECMCTECMRA